MIIARITDVSQGGGQEISVILLTLLARKIDNANFVLVPYYFFVVGGEGNINSRSATDKQFADFMGRYQNSNPLNFY